MPAGTKISFGVFQLGPGLQQATFELINTGACTCTTTPPQAPAPDDGAQVHAGRNRPHRLPGTPGNNGGCHRPGPLQGDSNPMALLARASVGAASSVALAAPSRAIPMTMPGSAQISA